MAACALVFKLLPPLRRRLCSAASRPARSAASLFSSASTWCQHHNVNRTSALTGKVDRFGGVTVNLAELGLPADISESSFSRLLQGEWSWSLCTRNSAQVMSVINSQIINLDDHKPGPWVIMSSLRYWSTFKWPPEVTYEMLFLNLLNSLLNIR